MAVARVGATGTPPATMDAVSSSTGSAPTREVTENANGDGGRRAPGNSAIEMGDPQNLCTGIKKNPNSHRIRKMSVKSIYIRGEWAREGEHHSAF